MSAAKRPQGAPCPALAPQRDHEQTTPPGYRNQVAIGAVRAALVGPVEGSVELGQRVLDEHGLAAALGALLVRVQRLEAER